MAILAAGVGFAIRGGIFDNWGADFGFTGTELGKIGGMGFIGFCFGIIIGGVIVDKVGYGKLVAAAFLFHVLSAIVTFMAAPGQAKEVAFAYLSWGMFIFAFANGTLEAVGESARGNLFPRNRTHYLNILHASWPLGMIAGAVIGWTLDEGMKMSWKIQLAFYLVPTVIYGLMFLGQSFPKSEASAKGIRLADMFKDVGLLGGAVICYLFVLFFNQSLGLPQGAAYAIGGVLLLAIGLITRFSFGSILLFVLFVTHAMVGAVELGTDQWIQNITGNILSPGQGQGALHLDLACHVALRFSGALSSRRV
jgi:MFS family permease